MLTALDWRAYAQGVRHTGLFGLILLGAAEAGSADGPPVGLVFDQKGQLTLFIKRTPRPAGGGPVESGLDYRLYFKVGRNPERLLLDPKQGFPAASLVAGATFGQQDEALVMVREGQNQQAGDVLYRITLSTGARTRLLTTRRYQLMDLTFASLKYNAATDHVSFRASRLVRHTDGQLEPQSRLYEYGPLHARSAILKP